MKSETNGTLYPARRSGRRSGFPKDSGKLYDREAMLLRYMSLVKIIVAKMRAHLPAHADYEELHSAGIIGLISAIDRFDASFGYTFETYASIRIRGAILDELRKLDMMPRSARSKLRRINQAAGMLEQRLGRPPTEQEISRELGLKEKKFRRMRAQAEPVNLVFLDQSHQSEEANLHELIADDKQASFPERAAVNTAVLLVIIS